MGLLVLAVLTLRFLPHGLTRESALTTNTALSRAPRLLLSSTPRNELIFIAILVALAMLVNDYYLDLVAGFLGLALLALSSTVIWGYAGILSFGQATFFGLGGYALGLTEMHWDLLTCPSGWGAARRRGPGCDGICPGSLCLL